jgi:hypothetical protein
MNFAKIRYLTATLAVAGLWACGDSGGSGGGGDPDANGSGTTLDAGNGGGGGAGGQGTNGGNGGGGAGGTPTGGQGGTPGGSGGGGAGGLALPADAGTGGATPDAAIGGSTTDALAPDASSADAAVDPDGSVDTICTPCATDDDCGGGTCLDVDGARFCTIHCAESAECGAGRICEPVDGQEGSFCLPADSCDAPPDCTDNDGDGYGVGASCLGPDCDDAATDVHPGLMDLCDGRNDDCDEVTDEDFAVETCGVGACVASSACVGGQVVACSPGVPVGDDSLCNGLDDDCDGSVDEAYVAQPCGFGVCAAESSCENGQEIACVPGDPLLADDTTCDGVDDDCNGQEDEDFVGQSCGEGACGATGVCRNGVPICEENPPLAPDDFTCNGVDDDCDGETDEEFSPVTICGLGACRRDGFCDAEQGGEVCTPGPAPAVTDETCDGVDDDCDGQTDEECGDNNFSFRLVQVNGAFVDVAIIYHQDASPLADAADTQPRLLNLWVQLGASVQIVPDDLDTDDDERASLGTALVAAEKNLTVIERPGNVVRLAALSAVNTNRIAPDPATGDAEIAILHLQAIANGPHALTWIANNPDQMITGTTIAPPEAMAILSLSSGAIGQ